MGWHRPYRLVLLLAVVVVALVLLDGGGGTDVAAAGPTIRGTVSAAGVPEGAADWTVEHPEPGVYRVAVPATDVVLDVVDWEGTPEVTVPAMLGPAAATSAVPPLGRTTRAKATTAGSRTRR